MDCENLFCIYFKEQCCTLDHIALDIQGQCQACIYVSLDEKLLEAERQKILQQYDVQDS